MMLLSAVILQLEPHVVDKVTEVVSGNLTAWQVIVISLITYFVGYLLQLGLSLLLKKVEIQNDRKKRIAELAITKEVEIYQSLIKLKGYQKGEAIELLDTLETLNLSINLERILLSKRYISSVEEILEYFSVICADFSKKDIKREQVLFDSLYKSFHDK